MSSGILRRTAYADWSKGYPIYHDYCVVETTLGPMVEFDAPFQRTSLAANAYNPANEAVRVDEVVSLSTDKRPAIMQDEAQGIMLQETSFNHSGY